MPPEYELLERFMRGEADLETVARAMSFDGGMLSFKGPPYTADEQLVVNRLTALAARIQAIETAERLVGSPTAMAQGIEAWGLPENPQKFCLSIEVVLQGQDGRGVHRQPMRVYVCTPQWLGERTHPQGWTWTPAPLVVSDWNPANIREAIAVLAGAGGDNTWADFVKRMGRYMEVEG
jgi:hypothetical protein